MSKRTKNETELADKMAAIRLQNSCKWELTVSLKYTQHLIATHFASEDAACSQYKALKKAVDAYNENSNFKDQAHEIEAEDGDLRCVSLKDISEFYLNSPKGDQ